LGSGLFDGQALVPVGAEIGHIVVISGTLADGTTPADLNRGVTLRDYIAGSVAVTHVVTPDVSALAAGETHALGMASPPNCGQEGCNAAFLWRWDWENQKLELVREFDLR
jgi:hypothetical protein